MLSKRAHPPPPPEFNLSDLMGPGVKQLKASKKKFITLTTDMNVDPRNILERQVNAIVVKKIRDNTGQVVLEYELLGFVTIEGLFGGTSAVGRSKVDMMITAQEHNDVFVVLFHLEQTIGLKDSQLMKLVSVENAEKEKVRFVNKMKKTLLMFLVEQVLSRNDVVTQMFVYSEGTPLVTINSKSHGTLMITPHFKFDDKPMDSDYNAELVLHTIWLPAVMLNEQILMKNRSEIDHNHQEMVYRVIVNIVKTGENSMV